MYSPRRILVFKFFLTLRTKAIPFLDTQQPLTHGRLPRHFRFPTGSAPCHRQCGDTHIDFVFSLNPPGVGHHSGVFSCDGLDPTIDPDAREIIETPVKL